MMAKTPPTTCSLLRRHRRPRSARARGASRRLLGAVAGVALAGTLAAGGGAAAAATRTAAPAKTPAATKAAAALCAKVSAEAVSKVVGHSVPAPQAAQGTSTFDKAKHIQGLLTECTYGQDSTDAEIKKAVEIDYATLSKPVTLSLVKQELKEEVAADAKVKFSDYNGLSVPAVYVVASEDGGTVEAMAGVQGTKLVIVGLGTAAPEREVGDVAALAVKAFM